MNDEEIKNWNKLKNKHILVIDNILDNKILSFTNI